MPKPLGVRATVSFGSFRQGRVYEIDLEDDRMMSLLGVGYLEPMLEDDDAGLDEPAGLDVRGDAGGAGLRDIRVVGSSQSSEGVSDVGDSAESSDDSAHGTSKRVRGRKASGGEDSARGSDSGEVRQS